MVPSKKAWKGKVKAFTMYKKLSVKFKNRIYTCFNYNLRSRTMIGKKLIIAILAASMSYIKLISVKIRWRYQKNKNHGEELKFKAIPLDPDTCPCKSAHSIVQRFVKLKVPKNTTLAIYKKKKNEKKRIFLTWSDPVSKENYESPHEKYTIQIEIASTNHQSRSPYTVIELKPQ